MNVHALFFVVQLFAQFDLKRNNIIDFGEFVRSLSVFHPKAPLEEKAECEHPARHRSNGQLTHVLQHAWQCAAAAADGQAR